MAATFKLLEKTHLLLMRGTRQKTVVLAYIQMCELVMSCLNGYSATGTVCMLSFTFIHMNRFYEIMLCCCDANGKASTPHYVLNIFQCLQ